MRHLNSGSKLGKQPAHRRAVLRSLVTNLFEHGRITTTLTRAKAARPVAEKMITLGKRDTLQSRRQAASYIMLPAVTQKLFSEIAPKFADRAGGYTRIIHPGNRRLRIQTQGKTGKTQEGRTRRSEKLNLSTLKIARAPALRYPGQAFCFRRDSRRFPAGSNLQISRCRVLAWLAKTQA